MCFYVYVIVHIVCYFDVYEFAYFVLLSMYVCMYVHIQVSIFEHKYINMGLLCFTMFTENIRNVCVIL